MSVRNLFREFQERLQTTPRAFVEAARLELARRLLEQTALSVDRVAARSGFKDAGAMRRAFGNRLGVSPRSYRDRFARPTRPNGNEMVTSRGAGDLSTR